MKTAIRTFGMLVVLLLSACVTINPPIRDPATTGPGWYGVKPTDTLYSIAWRYGLDYKQLAQWNSIDVNAPIHPGQRLVLIDPQNRKSTNPPAFEPKENKSKENSKVQQQAADTVISEPDDFNYSNPVAWIWPTEGKPLNSFSASKLDRRGIDIAGISGQQVVAVANGKVVYSGNGLAGYGNLIIIKHSETYLSAYAYCQERLVQEGAEVTAGKVIAKMGQRDNRAQLHFEIRKNGKPVDPLKYLPKD